MKIAHAYIGIAIIGAIHKLMFIEINKTIDQNGKNIKKKPKYLYSCTDSLSNCLYIKFLSYRYPL